MIIRRASRKWFAFCMFVECAKARVVPDGSLLRKAQIRACGTYAKRAKNEAGVPPLPNAHYALYVQAPKSIMAHSV